MKYLFLIFAISIIFSSCGNRDKTKRVDKEMSKEEIRMDSIRKQEELIVFGSIHFGMRFEEFEKSKDEFEEKCKVDYLGGKQKQIGDYRFTRINGYFYKGELYYVNIEGRTIGYEVYDNNMKIQYDALFSILEKKYSYPFYNNRFPEWHTIFKDDPYLIAEWFIGDKKVQMVMEECKNQSYGLNINIYKPSIAALIHEENEAKKQEAIKKGVEVL